MTLDPSSPNDLAVVVRDIVAAAAAALQQELGVSVAAGEPESVDVSGAAQPGAVVGRTGISGAGRGGILTMIAPEATSAVPTLGALAEPQSLLPGLIDPMFIGVAGVLGRALGAPVQAAPAEPVLTPPATVGMAVRFAIAIDGNPPITVTWLLETPLVEVLSTVRTAAAATPPAAASPAAAVPANGPVATAPDPAVAPASFPEFGAGAGPGVQRDLGLLSDVTMAVTVELGRATMRVRDLLALKEGSIVELDRVAGAAVDVLVNGMLVARGDVVVIDEDLGVRITEVVERP